MKHHDHPYRSPSPLPLLALALVASAGSAAGQQSGLAAETYGRASGDAPHAELGLVLELVDPGTSDARLRLFGGLPGQSARIVLSATKVEASPAPNGAVTLVGPSTLTFDGTFDWHGSFELPLDGIQLAPGQSLYAQGVHTGMLDFGGEPLVQLSHGLALHGLGDEEEEPLWFDDLLPHLPEETDLSGTSGLADRLQRMLNTVGDSARVAFEIEATAGLGIEVVDAKAGGNFACEFTVERTEEGLYELKVGADLVGLAGVSAGTGAEAGLEASGGYGAARIFRFHSAPGAARGILGIVLALRFPELQPGRLLENTGILGEAGARVAQLQELVQFAQQNAAELEAFLWDVLDGRVSEAERARSSAASKLSTANRNYNNAPWYLRPVYWAQVVACRAALSAAEARLTIVRTAREQGEIAVQLARSLIAAKRAELLAAVREVARIGRLATSIAQLRGWATDHHAGTEMRYKTAAEFEAQLKVPVIDVKNLGLGVSSELENEYVTRWEPARGERPAHVTVVQALKLERKAYGGLWYGGEVAHSRTIEVETGYEIGAYADVAEESTLSFTADTCVVAAEGIVIAFENGAGRTRSFSLTGERASDLASLFSTEDLIARLGAAEIGFELQDRRQRNIDGALAIDVSGTGGGLEFELEWADQGRMLSRSTTIAEGVERILNGAGEVIDAVNGTIALVE